MLEYAVDALDATWDGMIKAVEEKGYPSYNTREQAVWMSGTP